MGIGQRILQVFGGGQAPDEDPGAVVEAGVVLLPVGPMLVERLRQRGVDATGIESVDPVTGVRSYMRIMVRQSDLAAARQAFEEEAGQASDDGAALDDLTALEPDEEGAAAEEASQRAMSRLFVAADRLAGRPDDPELVTEIEELGEAVAAGPPPFGVEPTTWARVASLADAVATASDTEGGEEDGVFAAATALRDFLRPYV
ncbi:MAG: hypothetical protein ACR2MO_09850 [Acidimicrobiales bacterium]